MLGLQPPPSPTHDDRSTAGVRRAVDVVVGAPVEDFSDEPEQSGAIRLGETMPGTRLRVLERLSDGGSGVVFRGEHVELERPVAIKILRRVVRSDSDRERFLAEARLTTSIDSPHVVDVIDFGQLSDGRLWYAMELLDGRALSETIDTEGAMPLARVFTLLRMACKGLGATHARGMVHCDVKPHNLVLLERGGREQLVVVDFGIAHAIGTRPETVCGTPEYISPEQIDRGELDPRTDIYALGCCAYEMLTGRLLVEETSAERAVMRHVEGVEHGLVFPPEARVPECMQALVRSCLAREPERRPATMAMLEAALCEAQIRCGVLPTREDLELPDVERMRRDGIAIGFAGMVSPRTAVREHHAFFGGALTAAAAVALALLAMHGDPEPRAPGIPSTFATMAVGLGSALVSARPVVDASSPRVADAAPSELVQPSADPDAVLVEPPDDRSAGAIDANARPRRARAQLPTDYRKARLQAAKAVREHPESATARVQLGDALRSLGRSSAAARQYREAARLGSSKAKHRLRAIEAG
jgi:Protein kinase domain